MINTYLHWGETDKEEKTNSDIYTAIYVNWEDTDKEGRTN